MRNRNAYTGSPRDRRGPNSDNDNNDNEQGRRRNGYSRPPRNGSNCKKGALKFLLAVSNKSADNYGTCDLQVWDRLGACFQNYLLKIATENGNDNVNYTYNTADLSWANLGDDRQQLLINNLVNKSDALIFSKISPDICLSKNLVFATLFNQNVTGPRFFTTIMGLDNLVFGGDMFGKWGKKGDKDGKKEGKKGKKGDNKDKRQRSKRDADDENKRDADDDKRDNKFAKVIKYCRDNKVRISNL